MTHSLEQHQLKHNNQSYRTSKYVENHAKLNLKIHPVFFKKKKIPRRFKKVNVPVLCILKS